MTDGSRDGRCLCGAVVYRVAGPLASVLHCHCVHCRRTSGNFVAAARVADADLQVASDGDALRWVEVPDARYAFCRKCGSSLFFKADDTPDLTSVMVGTLAEADGLELGAVWFAADAQPHHRLDPAVPHHDGNDDS